MAKKPFNLHRGRAHLYNASRVCVASCVLGLFNFLPTQLFLYQREIQPKWKPSAIDSLPHTVCHVLLSSLREAKVITPELQAPNMADMDCIVDECDFISPFFLLLSFPLNSSHLSFI